MWKGQIYESHRGLNIGPMAIRMIGGTSWVLRWRLGFRSFLVKIEELGEFKVEDGEIIESSGGPRHLFTISLKNFYLFKIAESVINFCLKNFSN